MITSHTGWRSFSCQGHGRVSAVVRRRRTADYRYPFHGSTSSVGRSHLLIPISGSVISPRLIYDEKQNLRRKCTLIEEWAAAKGIDVTFFLIDENRFRH